jgi:hypothetical protein
MTSSQIRNRLARLVGEHEALDLIETPNGQLGGKSPQDLLDSGDFAPVMRLVENLELEEIARSKWMNPILDHIPQRRHSRGAGRIFAILDELERGGSK